MCFLNKTIKRSQFMHMQVVLFVVFCFGVVGVFFVCCFCL